MKDALSNTFVLYLVSWTYEYERDFLNQQEDEYIANLGHLLPDCIVLDSIVPPHYYDFELIYSIVLFSANSNVILHHRQNIVRFYWLLQD